MIYRGPTQQGSRDGELGPHAKTTIKTSIKQGMRDLLRSLEAGVLEVQTPDHAESSPDHTLVPP